MYDHEKSDPAIVAVKPTNKAGQPAAELVEPRAGAEGNVGQQSTGRAQYRVTVSQALEHIRNFVEYHDAPLHTRGGSRVPELGSTDLCGGREVTRVPTAEVDGAAKPTRMTQRGLGHRNEAAALACSKQQPTSGQWNPSPAARQTLACPYSDRRSGRV